MLGELGRDSRTARGAKRKTDREHRRGRGRGRGRGRYSGPRNVGEQPDRYGDDGDDDDFSTGDGRNAKLEDLVTEAQTKASAMRVKANEEAAGWEEAFSAQMKDNERDGVYAHLCKVIGASPLSSRLMIDKEDDAGGQGNWDDYDTARRLIFEMSNGKKDEAKSPESATAETPSQSEPVVQPTKEAPKEPSPQSTISDAAAEEALDELLSM